MKIKKLLLMLLAVVMLVTSFAGCCIPGSDTSSGTSSLYDPSLPSSASQPTTATFNYTANSSFMENDYMLSASAGYLVNAANVYNNASTIQITVKKTLSEYGFSGTEAEQLRQVTIEAMKALSTADNILDGVEWRTPENEPIADDVAGNTAYYFSCRYEISAYREFHYYYFLYDGVVLCWVETYMPANNMPSRDPALAIKDDLTFTAK